MGAKIRELICGDPLKCFGAFMVVNMFLFGLCAWGYERLDQKIESRFDVLNALMITHLENPNKAIQPK